MSQTLSNPFYDINRMIQQKQTNQLFSYILQLAQQYNLYIVGSYEAIQTDIQTDQKTMQQTIYIYVYLPHYIVSISINQQNKVSVSITPLCGGQK